MRGSRQNPGASDKGRHRTAECLIVCGRGAFAGYEDEVPALLKRGKAYRLPEPPFCFVTHDRVAYLAPYGVANAGHIETVGPGSQHQQTVGPRAPVPSGRFKITGPGETPGLGHRPAGRNEWASNCEARPALEYTPLQHAPSAAGTHTRSEAVHPAPPPLFWLICPLRHGVPTNSRLYAPADTGVNLALRGGLVCLNSAARFDKWNRAAVR